MKLEAKTALVTGAGQGIGRSIALALAREGARVAVADIDTAKAAQVKAEIEAAGGQASFFTVDLTRRPEVNRLVQEVLAECVLVQLYDVIAGLLIEYQRPLYITHREAETEIQAHWMLFDAIRRRDIDQACQLMRGHMAEVREFMLPFFEEQRNYRAKSEAPSSSLKKRNFSRS